MTDLTNDRARLAIMAGTFSPALRRLVKLRADEEAEMCRLAAVCGPDGLDAAEAEVEARAKRIAARWVEMPETPPEMTPRCAAARSVVKDIAEGLLTYRKETP